MSNMISNISELKKYIREDAKANGIKSITSYIAGLIAGHESCHTFRCLLYLLVYDALHKPIHKKNTIAVICLYIW